ncbi:hypothetical protein DFH29DRAFT_1017369 [Suillus ampliporus]|nr:hypothetical protein DFH29DRAFT_1017369 [Suillus ampliporus]
MLPFALKVVWFALSFSGIFACWIVLTVFARAIGSYWGPMLYCTFATMLQGIFCLGAYKALICCSVSLIYPAAQTFIIYYAANSLTGVCAAFTMATTSAVVWPSSAITTASSTLAWRNQYLLPILVFPLAALAATIPILLSLDAIQPTDDLHCDSSSPVWGRFLGYAGISMILTIPCFFLSATAAYCVFKTHMMYRKLSKLSASQSHPSSTERAARAREHTNPHSSPPLDVIQKSAEFGDNLADDHDRDVVMIPRRYIPHVDDMTASAASYDTYFPRYEILPSSLSSPPLSKHSSGTPQWDRYQIRDERMSTAPIEACTTSLPISGESFSVPGTLEYRLPCPRGRHKQPRKSLAPAIWRLILFQMAFFIIQFLAALSTVIDVAMHRPKPTPFGTQHVALVLVGWGPSIVFGHLPAVRRKLLFWRHPDPSADI